MMNSKYSKPAKYLAAGLLLLTVLLIAAINVKVPYYINTYSEVFPRERWLLTRGNGGQIISSVIDFTKGYTTRYEISQFERGEFVSADFSRFLQGRKEIRKGDTVVVLQSSDVLDRIITVEGELAVASANLKSQSSAQKESLIKESESRLKYITEQINEQKILYERARQLAEKGFISMEEFDLKKWSLDLMVIEKEIYEAQLENLRTGVKAEDIDFLESQIKLQKDRLKFLRGRESMLVIISPVNGDIADSFSPDTLINIVNYSQVVLNIPVKLEDVKELIQGDTVKVEFSGTGEIYNCELISVSPEVKIIENRQVVVVSFLMENAGMKFLPGMVASNSVLLGDRSIFDYIIKLIN